MLKNYFRTAWRNLRRNKLFSAINIVGLSIGISASLVIYLIVSYDLSFDKAHKDGDRTYRVVTDFIFSGEGIHNKGVTMPMAPAIRKDLAGLDLIVPFYVANDVKLSVPTPGKKESTLVPTAERIADPAAEAAVFKKQDHMMYADSNYFRLIAYDWLAGSPVTSLSGPYQAVLTESRATLYFPGLTREAIIGQRLYLDDTVGITVTGIVRDLPYHTAFSGKIFVSWATLENTSLKPAPWGQWGGTTSNSQLFVKLPPGGDASKMESKITALYHKYNGKDQAGNKTSYTLQPLSDLHFSPIYGSLFNGDQHAYRPTLYSLLVVAALLLLLASINFINLTTAQSTQRAKEIGIRKTIGSSRRQLIFQFLSETFLLTLAAVFLSILIAPFLFKIFADFIPKEMHFNILAQPGILVFGVILLTGVSLLSGLYPAMVLSAFRPVQVLKSQLPIEGGSGSRVWLRKTLTVGQFVIAQVFIMGTLLVSKQISYSLNKDLGFRKDAIVYFQTNRHDTTRNRRLVLVEKLKAIPGIAMVSLSSDIPSSDGVWSSEMKYKDGKKEVSTVVELKAGDSNYLRLYEMKLLAGKALPHSDTVNALIINETYMHTLGFRDPREIIGKRVEWNDERPVPVVGVVADFFEQSLHSPIKPLALCSELDNERTISVALDPVKAGGSSLNALIAGMKKAWSEVYPEDSFDYQFQDETLAQFYKGEQDTALLLRWATGLMVFISCLGLLGLVIYITNQRTKEIGIRKIVGASVAQIISLLSVDFLKLVVWAFLIAVPVAWWGAHIWLNNFAYQTELSWWIFVAGGLLMGGMALVILLLRTFRAASANPVDSLRSE